MGILKWYKRDPRAFLLGTAAMTLEETGAYTKILELIYIHDGALEDDDRAIARQMSIDVRSWRYHRKRLLALRKIYLLGGRLRNDRADREFSVTADRLRHLGEVRSKFARSFQNRFENKR
jgi:hypothetical protein